MATKCITVAGEVKLPLKTFRFRVKDKTSGKKLEAAARDWAGHSLPPSPTRDLHLGEN